MALIKHNVLFGTATNIAGETIAENKTNSAGNGPAWSTDKSDYVHMNIVIDMKTLTGTSPTLTFSIQEKISGLFVETARSTAISSTGQYTLDWSVSPSATIANSSGPFPALGMGTDKQVVTTAGGTIATVAADIYFCFCNS